MQNEVNLHKDDIKLL